MAQYLIVYQTSPLRGRCVTQVVDDLLPAAAVAERWAKQNLVKVLRCQLLGTEAQQATAEFALYDAKDPYEPTMTQAPVHEPEDDTPEEGEEETEE